MKITDNLIAFRVRKMLLSLKDHLYLLFKSAAHNHLRIQEIRRGAHGGVFCTFSFYSYTELKRYQKKARVFSFGLTSGLAMFLVGLVLVPAFFDPSGSRAAEGPTISTVSPASGPASGGTDVTISGSNFLEINDSYSKLMLHGDGVENAFFDSSVTPKNITANENVTQSVSQSKFGGKSAYFDGVGDYLSMPDSDDWDFTGDVTIEFWVNPDTLAGNPVFFGQSANNVADSNDNYAYYDTVANEIRWSAKNGAEWLTGISLAAGTWTHVALVRNGGNLHIFKNGVLSATSTTTGIKNGIVAEFRIGYGYNIGYFKGYIDEFSSNK